MKAVLAAAAFAALFAGTVAAQDKKDEKKDDKKIDAAKLVGKWDLTKSTEKGAPKGAVIEFTKDMKILIALEEKGKKEEFNGTYKVDGDKLTVAITPPDGGKAESDTDTIKSLTDDKLVLIDKKGEETELTKKK